MTEDASIKMIASVGKESACNAEDPGSIPGSGRLAGKGIGYSLQYSWASQWLSDKEFTCEAEDAGDTTDSFPGWGRSSRAGHSNPFQYSCLG